MRAGALFFPAVIASFIVTLFVVLSTTPVVPASDDPTQQWVRIGLGDTVRVELTQFYGPLDNGWVSTSTQEERRSEQRIGRIPARFETAPHTIFIPDTAAEAEGTLQEHLLGLRVGDAIRTPLIPAEKGVGGWTETFNVSRSLALIDRQERLGPATQVAPGENFSLDRHLRFWELRGHTLRMGYEWKCEDDRLWLCRVTELSRTTGTFAFERLARNGDRYPVTAIYGPVEIFGDLDWNVTVAAHADPSRFLLRMEPFVGARIQLRVPIGGPFELGTSEILAISENSLRLRYSPGHLAHPYLIGEDVYYDVVVVAILKP